MDNAGWHAQHRAKQQELSISRYRGPDGQFQPVEQVMPMDEDSIAGFSERDSPVVMAPTPPPKDLSDLSKYPDGPASAFSTKSSQNRFANMSAVERSNALRVARMNPHLQFMVGPLLRYDTVDDLFVWHGHVLIVTADSGSTYEPHPMLTYEWDPFSKSQFHRRRTMTTTSFDLRPHPADHDAIITAAPLNGNAQSSPFVECQQVPGHEIWVYVGRGGTFTFWRFSMQIPLREHEMRIYYSINHGQKLDFFVPGRNQNMRWAGYSCNGFSSGVNPDDFRGPGFSSGYDPLWVDMMMMHEKEPFHALVGGGDQLYCDGITREPELQPWVSEPSPEKRIAFPLADDIAIAIDRFFFNHYCHMFRSGAFARANSSIPMVNMLDDHDLIDGFGSYPDDLQRSPVFRHIGSRGYFFFLLFQCFINPAVDGLDDAPGKHIYKSLIIGGDGPYVPYPSHSFLTYLGPCSQMLLLDCRAERKLNQVCSPREYAKVFERLQRLPPGVEHLVLQLGIPIAYPRLVFLERSLSSKLNPLVVLGRTGSLGLSNFVNKFNADAELLDDLNDHWCSDGHKAERNYFIERLQRFGKERVVRITFFTGDVHCAAVGVLKTLTKGKNKQDIHPSVDHRYMVNIVSSAIVNTPPPNGVIALVSSLATKVHRTMHYADTDETMIPLFQQGTDGSSRKQKYIMGQRNWCCVKWDDATGDLTFDLRVEKVKGHGQTVGYVVRIPPPRWTPGVEQSPNLKPS